MMSGPVVHNANFKARAILLGERIDVRRLESSECLALAPLTLPVSGGGVAVLLRYGAAVLFDVQPLEEAVFVDRVRGFVSSPFAEPETEAVEIRIAGEGREGVEGGVILIKDASAPHLQTVAHVLGKSVVLGRYEQRAAQSFERIEPLAIQIRNRENSSRHARELLSFIADSILAEHTMVGRAEVIEKPEILWENPELERLYQRVEDEFEITERHAALERKLSLIGHTAQTALEMLQTRHSLRVEWYIVILIVFEICLTLYDMFLRGAAH